MQGGSLIKIVYPTNQSRSDRSRDSTDICEYLIDISGQLSKECNLIGKFIVEKYVENFFLSSLTHSSPN